jgi:hypothetical protein
VNRLHYKQLQGLKKRLKWCFPKAKAGPWNTGGTETAFITLNYVFDILLQVFSDSVRKRDCFKL